MNVCGGHRNGQGRGEPTRSQQDRPPPAGSHTPAPPGSHTPLRVPIASAQPLRRAPLGAVRNLVTLPGQETLKSSTLLSAQTQRLARVTFGLRPRPGGGGRGSFLRSSGGASSAPSRILRAGEAYWLLPGCLPSHASLPCFRRSSNLQPAGRIQLLERT